MSEPTTQIVSRETSDGILAQYSPEQMQVITDHIAKGATPVELQYFMAVSKRLGLDPFGRQIYFVKRWDGKAQKEIGTVQVAIDGFRAIAARTGLHAGTDEPAFDTEDGDHPNKATCTVYRLVKGERYPFPATARWSEYVQTYKRDGKEQLSPMWAKMPWLMLGKVAEALALRRAFPEYLSGTYTHDEMAQADTEERELDPNASPSVVTVETLDPAAKVKAKNETVFYINMILESVQADRAVVGKWITDTYGVAKLEDLTEAQAQELTVKLETKYADRIEKPKSGGTPPPATASDRGDLPPASPIAPSVRTDTPSKPVQAKIEPPAKRDWLNEARAVDNRQKADLLLADMAAAGETDFKLKTVKAILDGLNLPTI